MAIYVWDEERWWNESNLTTYATNLNSGGVTDLMALIYGHEGGGSMGWSSATSLGVWDGVASTKLADLITAMDVRGINVHGVMKLNSYEATGGVYSANSDSQSGKQLDLRAAGVQTWLKDVVEDAAEVSGIDGICLDGVQIDDFTYTEAQNITELDSFVSDCYDTIKAVSVNLKVSSWGNPCFDMNHPAATRTGRDQVAWANSGYQDFIVAAEYGSYWTWQFSSPYRIGGITGGNPPRMKFVTDAKAAITNGTPLVVLTRAYEIANGVKTSLGVGDKWTAILDAIRLEDNIGFADAKYITNAQLTELAAHRALYSSNRS